MDQFGKPFLTADPRYLAMINYEIDPAFDRTSLTVR
jgi:hypothetical protein